MLFSENNFWIEFWFWKQLIFNRIIWENQLKFAQRQVDKAKPHSSDQTQKPLVEIPHSIYISWKVCTSTLMYSVINNSMIVFQHTILHVEVHKFSPSSITCTRVKWIVKMVFKKLYKCICSRKGEVHLNQTNQKKCEGRLKSPFLLFSMERWLALSVECKRLVYT